MIIPRTPGFALCEGQIPVLVLVLVRRQWSVVTPREKTLPRPAGINLVREPIQHSLAFTKKTGRRPPTLVGGWMPSIDNIIMRRDV